MLKCPHCGTLNKPTVCFCSSCKLNVHFTGKLRPATGADDGSGDGSSRQEQPAAHSEPAPPGDLFASALLFGVVYFGISMGLGFVLFASAMGYAYGSGPIGFFPWVCTVALFIMHAPVMLPLWIMRLTMPGYETIEPTTVAGLMLIWSFALGWIRAKLKRPRITKENRRGNDGLSTDSDGK